MATGVQNSSFIDALNKPSTTKADAAKKKNDPTEIGGDEFLKLLITQLKNQDPMDPMKNDQFAVDMAQFTQVEQLVKINDKLEAQKGAGAGDVGSLASYLGREVSINTDKITVEGNDGGRVRIDLPSDAASVKIDLLNADGSVKESIDGGALAKGRYSIAMTDLQTTEGVYGYRVKATDANGAVLNVNPKVSGIVSGFIPGADPKLVVGSQEISPADITEVNLAG